MNVQPTPVPGAGPAPQAVSEAGGAASCPEPALLPNPYGIPDQVVLSRAGNTAGGLPADMSAALQKFYNAALGDDLHVASDPGQAADNRLLHTAIAGVTLLSLIGGPEALGLKLAAKETLKGGVEQITYHAIVGAGENPGKLMLRGGVKLSSDELKVGADLAGRGREVIARPASGVGKSADFLVDGKPTELKTMSNAKVDSAATSVTETIQKAAKQGKNVIIDARNQGGLTESKARAATRTAVRELPKSRINEVILYGRNGNQLFEIVVKK